ncbi:probable protein phosphatase 2C 37 [Zea mays]|uniref:protein-serine/threonine phosphatase n=1 Tax=Zea mays TaxID=4577 RepID=A0A075TDM8_MAIZE|nr:probable protein phosphatase 2C 37 [Zea mays]AIG52102.1 2C-type protein phosphatase protein [Zea mays]|eukprot:NP_001306679.1 probable protein phosphatase 2C 37 [Zea mays]
MTSAGVNVPGDDGVGNPAAASGSASAPECRTMQRRRRRLEPQGSGDAAAGPSWVRRLRPAASRFSPSPSQGSADRPNDEEQEEDDPDVQEMELVPLPPAGPQELQPADVPAQVWPVAFGSLSMAGRMRMMEDTISLHPDLCTWADGSPVHFFAVFDGHGGSHVSALCRDRMHEFVAEELGKEGAAFLRRRQEWLAWGDGAGAETSAAAFVRGPRGAWPEREEEERAWRSALRRSFRRADAMAALACACGRVARPSCRCPLSSVVSGIVGSTAVVALLVRGRLVVANCGDSRAVLCRGPAGTPPVPLSSDHKPNRPDERARIEAAGGLVVFNNGHRVRGILAMSRALGDRLLRPEVIAEPEITVTERTAEDECMILATDGMWDVIANDVACNVARHCLEDGNPPPAATAAAATAGREEEPRCVRATSLLARLAIGRETLDNVSIIVVDLKHRE